MPTSTLNDLELIGAGGVNLPDGTLEYLKANGGVGTTQPDLSLSSLAALGFPDGTWSDRLMAYLTSLGYSNGTLNDRLLEFWRGSQHSGAKLDATLTPGTDGFCKRGYLTGVWGALTPSTVEGKQVYEFSATNSGSVCLLRIGAAGNEKVTGNADSVNIGIEGYGTAFLNWSAAQLRYETVNPSIYFLLQQLQGIPTGFFIDY